MPRPRDWRRPARGPRLHHTQQHAVRKGNHDDCMEGTAWQKEKQEEEPWAAGRRKEALACSRYGSVGPAAEAEGGRRRGLAETTSASRRSPAAATGSVVARRDTRPGEA